MAVQKVEMVLLGQTYILQKESENKWRATGTAPSLSSYNEEGHYYPITLKAVDDAGNVTTVDTSHEDLGDALKLIVKEKVAPVITVTNPTAGAMLTNNKPTVTWDVTDNDSGVDPDTVSITIDAGTAITDGIHKESTAGGYRCSYTPEAALEDGSHTIKINASDHDGNASVQKSVTFKIDTVPPTLNVTSPADGLVTNQTICIVEGTTNDITSSPVTLTVKLNDGPAEKVETGENGSFSKELALDTGTNTITIAATDSAGKTTTVTRTVTVDTGAPQFISVQISENPVDAGGTFTVTVEVID